MTIRSGILVGLIIFGPTIFPGVWAEVINPVRKFKAPEEEERPQNPQQDIEEGDREGHEECGPDACHGQKEHKEHGQFQKECIHHAIKFYLL